MTWLLVVVYFAPNGETLMRSFHEYKTQPECLKELERAKDFPHPFGLKIDLSCKQATITIKN